MIVYIYSKCSTCQKAISFLKKMKNKEVLTIKEITDTPPSMEELQQMLQFKKGNLKGLFNTSGQLYRELHLNEKFNDMSLPGALTLLTQNGMLIKRPFLIGKNFGLTGFNETDWSKIPDCQV